MNADLHMHSKFSDGTQWPEAIVARAKELDLEMLALTDHDNMAGVDRFIEACKKNGIKGIPAVEIDYDEKSIGYSSELLGYFPTGNYIQTQQLLNGLHQNRIKLAETAIKIKATENNRTDLFLDDLLKNKLNEPSLNTKDLIITITKVDLFNYFQLKGLLPVYTKKEYKRFKKEFFNNPVFNKLNQSKPNIKELIQTINNDGGFAVLAHPAEHYSQDLALIKKDRSKIITIFKTLKASGLWGMELHSYNTDDAQRAPLNDFFKKVASEVGLNLTYGSDSHGKGSGKDWLGRFYGEFEGFV